MVSIPRGMFETKSSTSQKREDLYIYIPKPFGFGDIYGSSILVWPVGEGIFFMRQPGGGFVFILDFKVEVQNAT